MESFDFEEWADIDNATLNQLDAIATQELLQNITVIGESSATVKSECVIPVENPKSQHVRFPEPLKSAEFEDNLKLRIPATTRNNNNWAISVFKEWRSWRQFLPNTKTDPMWPIPDLNSATDEQLDYWLGRFIYETRGKDGTPYSPSTLTNLAAAIQRHLREDCKRQVNLFKLDDANFKTFRASLHKRRKELYASGVGVQVKHADPITEHDEMCLWDSEVLNTNTAQGLLYIVYLYNCKVFGMRAYNEHESLMAEQFTFGVQDGNNFIKFNGRLAKNFSAGLNSKVAPKSVTHYADPSNERCVLAIFQKYLSYIPPTGRFYRRPLVSKAGEIAFSKQPVGRDTIRSYIPQMFKLAGINTTGRNITNHSGKVTCCTRLYSCAFDEQAIKSRSGHRSSAVELYKRPSLSLEKDISTALQPPRPKSAPPAHTISATPASVSISPAAISTPDVHLSSPCHMPCTPSPNENSTLTLQIPKNITRVVIEKDGKKITIEV